MRWTTIGLSAAAEHPLTPDAERENVNWKQRIASVWIPSVLGLGLLMAFAYVGVRIVAGKSHTERPIAKETKENPAMALPAAPASAPAVPNPPKASSKPSPTAISTNSFTLITPQHGERYLQVAAVTPHMVLTYVDTLREANLQAVVAPGPAPELMRILVGPFKDHDSMDHAKALLEATGKHPFVRDY